MDPFLGEIRLFGLAYEPKGWAFCDGRLLSISQNTALFSLLGVMYGGDGRSTFGLPDLRGRAAVGMGMGAGLSSYVQGELVGSENVTLLSAQMPMHAHTFSAQVPVSTRPATQTSPANSYFARTSQEQYGTDPQPSSLMANDLLSGTTNVAGGSQPHENRMPFLVMNYAIALQGVYPPRP